MNLVRGAFRHTPIVCIVAILLLGPATVAAAAPLPAPVGSALGTPDLHGLHGAGIWAKVGGGLGIAAGVCTVGYAGALAIGTFFAEAFGLGSLGLWFAPITVGLIGVGLVVGGSLLLARHD